MNRILCIDYGSKKIGFAVTDMLQIAVHPLETKLQADYWSFLEEYLNKEQVGKVVIGYPEHADGTPTKIFPDIKGLKRKIEKNFPVIEVVLHAEDFSSKRAKEIILRSGAKKKRRQDKMLVDKISAVVILQDYLGHI
jgi:putative Holliday junction resolvase